MDPGDHEENMCCVPGSEPPVLYQAYVEDILKIIRHNARCEFKILWEQMSKGRSSTDSTDRLSAKINFLTDTIFRDLIESADQALIDKVLRIAIPRILIDHVGFDNILKNTPRNYLMAMVATNLASKYVYENGMDASEFRFYTYLQGIITADC
jgi:glutamate dehydrogenase